ncbi:dnaJ homolog subfamily C member 8-like isoform X1 [Dysidea avara]|uniref:dnaJ homolog subfamily C member 8-like isoform X1 n=1 Tax=Dysidea avara TaxID=196820 RepID=UPI00332EF0A7
MVKAIEKKDSVLTGPQQIDQLLRPGSTYFNLNPYELSMLVHPDKNPGDVDRAQKAFDAVNKAYKLFEDEEQVKYCEAIVEEARSQLETKIIEKRKEAKKKGKDLIEEDMPEEYSKQLKKLITKLFADIEIKKKEMEKAEERDRKRQLDEEQKQIDAIKKEKEWKQEWDAGRDDRVGNWRSFQGKRKSKLLKPPKLKTEKRNT